MRGHGPHVRAVRGRGRGLSAGPRPATPATSDGGGGRRDACGYQLSKNATRACVQGTLPTPSRSWRVGARWWRQLSISRIRANSLKRVWRSGSVLRRLAQPHRRLAAWPHARRGSRPPTRRRTLPRGANRRVTLIGSPISSPQWDAGGGARLATPASAYAASATATMAPPPSRPKANRPSVTAAGGRYVEKAHMPSALGGWPPCALQSLPTSACRHLRPLLSRCDRRACSYPSLKRRGAQARLPQPTSSTRLPGADSSANGGTTQGKCISCGAERMMETLEGVTCTRCGCQQPGRNHVNRERNSAAPAEEDKTIRADKPKAAHRRSANLPNPQRTKNTFARQIGPRRQSRAVKRGYNFAHLQNETAVRESGT